MTDKKKWSVVMVCPGEEELALLAELSARPDTCVVGLVDPEGFSLGAGLAEILGLKVYRDLASLPAGQARHLIHPRVNEQIAPIVDAAPEHGLEAMTAKRFSGLMLQEVLARPAGPRVERPKVNQDFLEMETSAIHRTLSRLEEALDRESLLRWLLGLATRATRAGSGSIMLYDEPAGELYLAFAYGLSETTMHRTRVRLGEGIAGEVAATGKTRQINQNPNTARRRDRSQIKSAISAPIHWDSKLIGVLNISSTEGEDDLVPNALDIIESLTHRFGMILDRFLRMQTVRDGEQFRKMEEEFTRDTGQPELMASTLVYWAEDLASLAQADEAILGLVTADGDLLLADSEEIWYESPADPVRNEVLTTGDPVVLRSDPELATTPEKDRTTFILPVGKPPCRSLISLTFYSAARAHHFHSLSNEVLYLVNRHLANFLEKAAAADQMDRLTSLAATLSDLALGGSGDLRADRERLLASACSLTGGRKAGYMTDENNLEGCHLGTAGPVIRSEAHRLLEQARDRGWSASILNIEESLDGPGPRRSMLVVPLVAGEPFPGLVILDKKRLHPIDGESFTEFDALFARRLAPLLGRQVETREPEPQPVDEPRGMQALEPGHPAPAQPEIPPLASRELDAFIRSEMDRCDRYHTRMGLVGFRLTPPTGPLPEMDKVTHNLAQKLRTSDRAGLMEDGTILVVVPEDIQSLPRLQKRVTTLLQDITGQADLLVTTAARVYPGGAGTAAELIQSVIKGMS
jgi:GAF domain-containing protein|nr:GAF domain-containing protein [Candidatus Krumholzibacteria bacterium]